MKKFQKGNMGGGSGQVYGLGFIGALVYYIQQAHGLFGAIITGILKAMVWPAFLVHRLLGL